MVANSKNLLNTLANNVGTYKIPNKAPTTHNNELQLKTTRARLMNGIEKLSTINPNNNNKKRFGVIKETYNGKLKQIENLLKPPKNT